MDLTSYGINDQLTHLLQKGVAGECSEKVSLPHCQTQNSIIVFVVLLKHL